MRRAWMVDVYGTLFDVDIGPIWNELANLADVPADDLRLAADGHVRAVMTGEMTLGAAFAAAVTTCGVTATDSLVSEMVRLDSRLLRHRCTVHADAVTFIRGATDRAEPTALVSNCAENTRPLLDALGLSSLVDAVVLSHEVGSAKPDRGIFVAALAALGSDAADTTLIDDQLAYCRGARAAGLHAVHLTRTGNPPERDPDIPTVASFEEIGLS